MASQNFNACLDRYGRKSNTDSVYSEPLGMCILCTYSWQLILKVTITSIGTRLTSYIVTYSWNKNIGKRYRFKSTNRAPEKIMTPMT